MSDETENTPTEATDTPENVAPTDTPQIGILGQFIKDLSFENPAPAQTLQKLAKEQPNMDINVSLNARTLGEDIYEVDLIIWIFFIFPFNQNSQKGQPHDKGIIIEGEYEENPDDQKNIDHKE